MEKKIPQYFAEEIASRFGLTEYTSAVNIECRFPSTPIMISPQFLNAPEYLRKCSEELDQSATHIFFLTKLSNLSRNTFKSFLKDSKKCRGVYLIPKLIFTGYESPAPFPLCLLELTADDNNETLISVW